MNTPHTKKAYAEYCARVAAFLDREGIEILSPDGCEFFSWHRCECCGDTDGGMREEAEGVNPGKRPKGETYCICTDCVSYSAYGRLDDATMMNIEASAK